MMAADTPWDGLLVEAEYWLRTSSATPCRGTGILVPGEHRKIDAETNIPTRDWRDSPKGKLYRSRERWLLPLTRPPWPVLLHYNIV